MINIKKINGEDRIKKKSFTFLWLNAQFAHKKHC